MRIYVRHAGVHCSLRLLFHSRPPVGHCSARRGAVIGRNAPACAMTAADAHEETVRQQQATSSRSSDAGRKLRVLCLHGYQQNGEVGHSALSRICVTSPCVAAMMIQSGCHSWVACAGVQLPHRVCPQSAAQPSGVPVRGRADAGEARAGVGRRCRWYPAGRADVVGVDGASVILSVALSTTAC